MVAPAAPKRIAKRQPKNVPDYLIYEIMDGKPIYYKGYRDVLNKLKQPEEIMGCSNLQWVILSHLAEMIYMVNFASKKYWVAINEPGLHLNTGNNLSGDILVYNKADFQPSDFKVKYSDKPAFIHIEVDVTADFVNDMDSHLYLQKKINKLMDFGTQKIIWIFSATKQVLVVTKKEEWHWADWNKSIELVEGQNFNIGEYLDKEGIVV
jgi:hypothetical protein